MTKIASPASQARDSYELVGPVVYNTIIDQAYDPVRKKKYVRQQSLPFCSEEHANHHQWSCEG
jgi:hypothetical protein